MNLLKKIKIEFTEKVKIWSLIILIFGQFGCKTKKNGRFIKLCFKSKIFNINWRKRVNKTFLKGRTHNLNKKKRVYYGALVTL